MEGNDEGKLPRFQSLDELVTFFDGNDLGGYDLPEVEISVKKNVPVNRREAQGDRGMSLRDRGPAR